MPSFTVFVQGNWCRKSIVITPFTKPWGQIAKFWFLATLGALCSAKKNPFCGYNLSDTVFNWNKLETKFLDLEWRFKSYTAYQKVLPIRKTTPTRLQISHPPSKPVRRFGRPYSVACAQTRSRGDRGVLAVRPPHFAPTSPLPAVEWSKWSLNMLNDEEVGDALS